MDVPRSLPIASTERGWCGDILFLQCSIILSTLACPKVKYAPSAQPGSGDVSTGEGSVSQLGGAGGRQPPLTRARDARDVGDQVPHAGLFHGLGISQHRQQGTIPTARAAAGNGRDVVGMDLRRV